MERDFDWFMRRLLWDLGLALRVDYFRMHGLIGPSRQLTAGTPTQTQPEQPNA